MEESTEETKNSIPQDIIFQVLKELPAKSLLRFRCVSKLWRSIVDSPLFVNSHRGRSHTRQGGITILMLAQPYPYGPDGEHVTHFFSINPQGIEPPCPVQTLPFADNFSLIQFVNGLVCYGNNVWNPSTREILTLPPVPCELVSNYTKWTFFSYCFLGFAPNSNEYKVVNICQKYRKGLNGDKETGASQCKILTLGLGTGSMWRDIDSDSDDCLASQLSNFYMSRVCCVNGTIYCWGTSQGKILAFDVEQEKFRYICHPDDANFSIKLIQVRDCLALINTKLDKIWMLDESMGVNWKTESLIIPHIYKTHGPWRMLIPVGSIHRGDEILLHWRRESDEILHLPEGRVQRKEFLELFYYELQGKSLRKIFLEDRCTAMAAAKPSSLSSSSQCSLSLNRCVPDQFHRTSLNLAFFNDPLTRRLVSVSATGNFSPVSSVDGFESGSDTQASSSSLAIDFLTLCHSLKTTKRKGWINHGIKGPESIADHMYRMALMALIARDLPGVNRERCIKIAIVHDIAEAIAEEIKELWAEYENNSSIEANLVKDFDKVEMILQALEYEMAEVAEHGKVLDEFFLSTTGKFQTEIGKSWAAEINSRRNSRLANRLN
ncbi:unnamed protein product [Camellia sinensis]